MLIVEFYVSYLLYQRSLILKLFLWCDCKLSVGCIQTGNMYLLSLQACEELLQGCKFYYYYTFCHQYIDWLKLISSSYSSLNLCRKVFGQSSRRPIRLTPQNYLVSDLNIFNKKSYLFCCLCFNNCFGC